MLSAVVGKLIGRFPKVSWSPRHHSDPRNPSQKRPGLWRVFGCIVSDVLSLGTLIQAALMTCGTGVGVVRLPSVRVALVCSRRLQRARPRIPQLFCPLVEFQFSAEARHLYSCPGQVDLLAFEGRLAYAAPQRPTQPILIKGLAFGVSSDV